MIKIVIGSLVLCHLLVPGPESQTSEKTIKVLGEVLEIQKGSKYIEVQESREALKVETDVLIVKGKNTPGIYQIDSLACLSVRNETDEERKNRLMPKPKQTEEEPDDSEESVDSSPEEETFPLEKKQNQSFPEENKPVVDESKEPEIKEFVKEDKEITNEENKENKIKAPEEANSIPKAQTLKKDVEAEPQQNKKGLFDYLK